MTKLTLFLIAAAAAAAVAALAITFNSWSPGLREFLLWLLLDPRFTVGMAFGIVVSFVLVYLVTSEVSDEA